MRTWLKLTAPGELKAVVTIEANVAELMEIYKQTDGASMFGPLGKLREQLKEVIQAAERTWTTDTLEQARKQAAAEKQAADKGQP